MPEKGERETPIRESVHVDCPIDDAFRLFTDGFGEWWPLTRYSNAGDEADTCVIEPWVGGRVFERSRSGEECDWGSVTTWDPPNKVSFTWDPGGSGDGEQRVDVQFDADADGTEVTLVHAGWETPGVAVCAAAWDSAAIWSTLLTQYFLAFATEEILVSA